MNRPLIHVLHSLVAGNSHPDEMPLLTMIGKDHSGNQSFIVKWHDGKDYRVSVTPKEDGK